VVSMPARGDETRIRAGVGLEGGAVAMPDENIGLGAVGFYGRFGAQIGNVVSIYDAPGVNFVAAPRFGSNILLKEAIMIDFTIHDRFTVGVGPSTGLWLGSAGVEGQLGGTVHLAAYPWLAARDTGRRGFAVSLDLTPAFAMTGLSGPFSPDPKGLFFALVGVGYETF